MITKLHQSQLGMFLRCPRQFEFRYIEKIIRPPGIAARRGSAVHKAAEKNHIQKLESDKDLPIDELTETARDHYIYLIENEGVFIDKSEATDKTEQRKLIDHGLDQAIGATNLYHSEIAPEIKPDLVEWKNTVDIGIGIPISGIIDVADKKQNIIDLKVMKSKNQWWADRELQPLFYSFLYQAATGNWPNLFLYELMVPNKKPVRLQLKTERLPEQRSLLEKYTEIFLKAIDRGIFPPNPTGWLCSPTYCGYFRQCEFGG